MHMKNFLLAVLAGIISGGIIEIIIYIIKI